MVLIFTIAGLPSKYKFPFKGTLSLQEKKQIRLQITDRFPDGFIPFHAVLLCKDDEVILISGPTGAGKSSLAKFFSKSGYQILANDFVVVWKEKGKLMAGDLNLISANKRKTAQKVKKIIFLSPDDPRDCFRFTRRELNDFYCQTFAPFPKKHFERFYSYKLFEEIYKVHFSTGNRQSVGRWAKTILWQKESQPKYNIGIIGLGTIGQAIANLLLTNKQLQSLNLFSPNQTRLKGLVLDLKSARSDCRISSYSSPSGVIRNSDILILCFRVKTEKLMVGVSERMQKFIAHAEVVWQLTRQMRKLKFTGKVLVVTNPTDCLSWATYFYSNLNEKYQLDWKGLFSNQVMGVGLGLDFARLQVVSPGKSEIVGEHGENFILCQTQKGLLTKKSDSRIKHLVGKYSERVREYTERTVFGPSHEILRVVESLMSGEEMTTVRVSSLDKRGFFWGNIFDLHMMIPSPHYDFSNSLGKEIDRIGAEMKPFQSKEVVLSEKTPT